MAAFIQALPRPPLMVGANFSPAWAGWFTQAEQILQDISSSGPTTQRPTTLLYVGKFYFDTTLGYPVWMKTPATNTWVNAAGTTV